MTDVKNVQTNTYGFEDIENFVKVRFYFKDLWKLKEAFYDFVNKDVEVQIGEQANKDDAKAKKKNIYYITDFKELHDHYNKTIREREKSFLRKKYFVMNVKSNLST